MCQFDLKILNINNKSHIEIEAYYYFFKTNTIAPGGKFIHRHPRGLSVMFYAKYTVLNTKCDNLTPKSCTIITKAILELKPVDSSSK